MALPANDLVSLLQMRARGSGAQQAYTYLADGEQESMRLTFCELERAARGLAAVLERDNVSRSCVILAYPPGVEFVIAFFACLYANLVAVPVCPPHPRKGHERLSAIALDCGAARLLTTAAGKRAIDAAKANGAGFAHLGVVATDAAELEAAGSPRAVPVSPATVAFLQYTSGSTRAPRGVRITHGNVLANLAAIHAAERNDEHSRSVSWLPAYHDMGLVEGVLQPLYGGFSTWLMAHTAFLQRPLRWLQAVSRFRATVSGGPNFAYDACVRRIAEADLEGIDLSAWRVAYCGAEPVRAATLEAFAARFAVRGFRRGALRPVYGLAEATLLVTASDPDAAGPRIAGADKLALEQGRFMPASHAAAAEVVSCGRPAAGTEVRILDAESRSALPPGRVGEVWVSGPGVSAGYYTAACPGWETFRSLTLGATPQPWLCTGDLGFIFEGELYITGRSKDLIILHGRKLHPQDIEHTVQHLEPRTLDAVAAFAVDGIAADGVVVLAELSGGARARSQASGGYERYADAIRTQVFREHEVAIAALAFLPPGALARTSSGKLMRFRCKQDFVSAQLPLIARFDAPRMDAWRR